jgi:hypothetical protein
MHPDMFVHGKTARRSPPFGDEGDAALCSPVVGAKSPGALAPMVRLCPCSPWWIPLQTAVIAQGSPNRTANVLKSSVGGRTLLGWLRLTCFAWSGKELLSSLPTAYYTFLHHAATVHDYDLKIRPCHLQRCRLPGGSSYIVTSSF